MSFLGSEPRNCFPTDPDVLLAGKSNNNTCPDSDRISLAFQVLEYFKSAKSFSSNDLKIITAAKRVLASALDVALETN